MTSLPSPALEPRVLAQRFELAQAEQTDRTPHPSREGVPALHIAGGRAIFFGPRSPDSVAIGVGLAAPVSTEELDQIEAFLGQGGGAVRIELNPFCDPSLAAGLATRGYRVEQFQQVWWNQLSPVPPQLPPGVEVRPILPDEERTWARLFFFSYVGWPAFSEADLAPGLAIIRTEGNTCFFALVDGEPQAVGVFSQTGGVAVLSGDGIPRPFRGNGLQVPFVQARLAWAAQHGCELMCAATEPLTASARTCEKVGLRCAYPKLVMVREPATWA
jgi:hypothetical protein